MWVGGRRTRALAKTPGGVNTSRVRFFGVGVPSRRRLLGSRSKKKLEEETP
jgi:hypothetical protein